VIASSQHGFVKRKPCLNYYITFYVKMMNSVEAGRAVDLDLGKAFHTMPCNIPID